MKIILDVNVILSALIKDSTTRKIILESGLDFYFPEPSLHKIRKYEELVLQKSDMLRDVYLEVLTILFRHIKLIPTEEILKHWGEGKEIMAHIDEEDVVFVATALGLDRSVIWSDDKDFDKQDRVSVLKTREVMDMIGD